MTRILAISALVAVLLVSVVLGWLVYYRRGLHPTLVFTRPLSQCEQLSFDNWQMADGPEVDRICQENGVTGRPVFALRGRTAVRFKPEESHGVHGTLEMSQADNDTVYFYTYRSRYRNIVQQP